MGKEDILLSISNSSNQLQSYKNQLENLEEKYGVIEVFQKKCENHISAFDASMEKRKRRLKVVEDVLSRANCATKYKQMMEKFLSGTEYINTTSAIEQLQTSVANEKRNIILDMYDLENRIAMLERNIDELQYEYNNYPEEVSANE